MNENREEAMRAEPTREELVAAVAAATRRHEEAFAAANAHLRDTLGRWVVRRGLEGAVEVAEESDAEMARLVLKGADCGREREIYVMYLPQLEEQYRVFVEGGAMSRRLRIGGGCPSFDGGQRTRIAAAMTYGRLAEDYDALAAELAAFDWAALDTGMADAARARNALGEFDRRAEAEAQTRREEAIRVRLAPGAAIRMEDGKVAAIERTTDKFVCFGGERGFRKSKFAVVQLLLEGRWQFADAAECGVA